MSEGESNGASVEEIGDTGRVKEERAHTDAKDESEGVRSGVEE